MPKILIAEDNSGTAGLLKTLLELEGHQVVTTSRAAAITTLLRTERPDLLLLDLHLGPQDGLEIVCKIRGAPDTAHLPIVVISGLEKSVQAGQSGADGFILKPFGARELLKAIDQALSRRKDNAPGNSP